MLIFSKGSRRHASMKREIFLFGGKTKLFSKMGRYLPTWQMQLQLSVYLRKGEYEEINLFRMAVAKSSFVQGIPHNVETSKPGEYKTSSFRRTESIIFMGPGCGTGRNA
jgi:hypothetical protein